MTIQVPQSQEVYVFDAPYVTKYIVFEDDATREHVRQKYKHFIDCILWQSTTKINLHTRRHRPHYIHLPRTAAFSQFFRIGKEESSNRAHICVSCAHAVCSVCLACRLGAAWSIRRRPKWKKATTTITLHQQTRWWR